MAKKPTKSRALTASNTRALITRSQPQSYPIADTVIEPDQLFWIGSRQPSTKGPWSDEPGKISWRDEASGLDCIILRRRDGALSGYVSVSASHPFAGFNHAAIPGSFGIAPHGGLDYSRQCDERGPESVRICHTDRVRTNTSEQGVDAWWFGFSCNTDEDLIPGRHPIGRNDRRTYRDQAYVYNECVELARQLAGIGNDAGDDRHIGAAKAIGMSDPVEQSGGKTSGMERDPMPPARSDREGL